MQSVKVHLNVADNGKDAFLLGYPMHLTPTELRILCYIADHGCADADTLLAHCYEKREANVANVSVRISAINHKAAAIGGRRLIQFVYGRGYKFCDDI